MTWTLTPVSGQLTPSGSSRRNVGPRGAPIAGASARLITNGSSMATRYPRTSNLAGRSSGKSLPCGVLRRLGDGRPSLGDLVALEAPQDEAVEAHFLA